MNQYGKTSTNKHDIHLLSNYS